jgi:hypothetical protein
MSIADNTESLLTNGHKTKEDTEDNSLLTMIESIKSQCDSSRQDINSKVDSLIQDLTKTKQILTQILKDEEQTTTNPSSKETKQNSISNVSSTK